MKKFFSIVCALVCAITMSAVQVTFNFSSAEGLAAMGITPATIAEGATQGEGVDFTTATLEGVTLTGDKGSNKTSVRVWTNLNGSTELRAYNGNTLTIKGNKESDRITHIEVSGTDVNFTELTAGQWTGSENSVTLNTTATRKVKTITITLNEAAVEYKPDTISVSQAIALIKGNDPLQNKSHYIKGVVAGDPFNLSGNTNPAFYLTDIENPTDSLEGYKIGKDASTSYKDAEEMAADFLMGDTILIFANALSKYNNIFETTGGYFVKVLGKSDAIILDWDEATATLGEGSWNILIEKDSKNFIDLNFASSKKDGIAGSHAITEGTITYNGAEAAIVGSIKFTFKELSENSLNIYNVQAVLNAGEKLYRLTKDIEVYAQDADEEGIDLEGDRPFVPTEDGQEATCAQAREYALSLASGSESELSLTVEGYVTDLFNTGVTFWMDDQKGTTKTLQVYSFKNLVAEEGIELQNGAHVKVVGKVKNYNGTPEVINATVEILDGGKEIVPVKASVAEALAAAKALAQGKTSDKTYEIHGFIASIEEEFSADHSNMSFKMSDQLNDANAEFVAFRVNCDATLAEDLLVGARVQVTAKVQHFHQNATEATDTSAAKPERTVYETVKGGKVELIFHTATETIKVDVQAIKFIENGQVIILRDGVRYNVQGQLAK